MASEKGSRKDKNQNIQVFVRLRPLNQRERDIKSLGVVEVVHNREVVVRQSQQTTLTKKFTFDRAFGPNAKQVEVYQEVVSPLIEEVLAGYNCTVFAYGQTGTGKTHTMVGENTSDETTWQNDPLAGIIPRALSQLFDELRISNTEYTVRVSYLELYNEELFDLLSTSEDNSKLRIYEDVTRKGSNIVNGLEEITVYNKNEVYKIMAQGQERKRVASTLMNAQSSRSHTVFTIVVHMKENSPEGEELVKIGKLNLVDLAGSENISKAGSDNPAKRERARECVNINQSLLTLGRVITALVERHPHIPYRESKLTRILQESLGGRTKTSIIATISPGHKDLEETMSTLEYAHRAKNIQNKPEINQKMTKKAILKEYAEEIDRLKRDLQAARDKNGVYLANETYTEMTLKQEEQRKEIQELLLKKRAMEDEKDKLESVFKDISTSLEKREMELNRTKNKLLNTKTQLVNTANLLVDAQSECSAQKALVAAVSRTEAALSAQARELLRAADSATSDVKQLADAVRRRTTVEETNLEITKTYRKQSASQREYITEQTTQVTQSIVDGLKNMHTALENLNSENTNILNDNIHKLETDIQMILDTAEQLKQQISNNQSQLVSCTSSHRSSLESSCKDHESALRTLIQQLTEKIHAIIETAKQQDVNGNVNRFVMQWLEGAGARVVSLQQTCACVSARVSHAAALTRHNARQRAHQRSQRTDRRINALNDALAVIEEDRIQCEKRLSQQVEAIESERESTKQRLAQWAEDERRQLEIRIQQHVECETRALEDRLSKKLQEIDEERSLLSARVTKHIEWHKSMMKADEEEHQLNEQELQQTESVVEDSLNTISKFDKDIDEETSAISTDMEALSCNVVQVVDHSYTQLIDALKTSSDVIQNQCSEILSRDAENNKHLISETEMALEKLINDNKELGEHIINSLQSNNTSTISNLKQLSSSLSAVVSSCSTHVCSHESSLNQLVVMLHSFQGLLQETVDKMRDIEETYLEKEYSVYKPTGATPSRVEYRYPRSLAATSPHHRVLQRHRDSIQRTHQECIVLESDDSHPPSDSETSISEESLFLAPSPPSPPSPSQHSQLQHSLQSLHSNQSLNEMQPPAHTPRNQLNGIMKSTSDIDIYAIKRHQENGKENANRSINSKKPSKLPAPASHKKPLVDRNGIVH